jgi:hypothetical protein
VIDSSHSIRLGIWPLVIKVIKYTQLRRYAEGEQVCVPKTGCNNSSNKMWARPEILGMAAYHGRWIVFFSQVQEISLSSPAEHPHVQATFNFGYFHLAGYTPNPRITGKLDRSIGRVQPGRAVVLWQTEARCSANKNAQRASSVASWKFGMGQHAHPA